MPPAAYDDLILRHRHPVVTLRRAFPLALVTALAIPALPARGVAQDPAIAPPANQCAAAVAVTCPARREITAVAGYAPESFSLGFSWTTVRRFGVYARFFPGLDPSPGSAPDTTIRAESLTEYGIAYRLTAPITIGLGYGRFTRTDTDYGGIDPVNFRPTFIERRRSGKSGPALFVAYAFHAPTRAIGLAASVSIGAVGSGLAVGTTLRFPLVRAPIGMP